MNTWLKDNAAGIGAICVVLGLFGGFAKAAVVDPIHQRFDVIDQRFDDLRAEMNQRFDQQDKYMNTRFDAVEQRFDQQDRRLDGLTEGVSELRKLTTRIAERVSRNEGQIDLITERLQPVPDSNP